MKPKINLIGGRKQGKTKLQHELVAYAVIDLIEQTKSEIVADYLNQKFGFNRWSFRSLKDRFLAKTLWDRTEEIWLDNELLIIFQPVVPPEKSKENGVFLINYSIKKQ